MAEERINEFEGRSIGIIQSEEVRKRKCHKSLGQYQALFIYIYIKWKFKKNRKKSKNIFEEIMSENSPTFWNILTNKFYKF